MKVGTIRVLFVTVESHRAFVSSIKLFPVLPAEWWGKFYAFDNEFLWRCGTPQSQISWLTVRAVLESNEFVSTAFTSRESAGCIERNMPQGQQSLLQCYGYMSIDNTNVHVPFSGIDSHSCDKSSDYRCSAAVPHVNWSDSTNRQTYWVAYCDEHCG